MPISISKDFSDVPAGRSNSDGNFSGEKFREEYLIPALQSASESDPLVVDINGVEGYGSSFLEEAFGGLVREHGYCAKKLHRVLQINADDGYVVYEQIIWEHINRASRNISENTV